MPDEPTVPMPKTLIEGVPGHQIHVLTTQPLDWKLERDAIDAELPVSKARAEDFCGTGDAVTLDRAVFDAMVEALQTAQDALHVHCLGSSEEIAARHPEIPTWSIGALEMKATSQRGIALQMLRDRRLL